MSCLLCGNPKVRSYAGCRCKLAMREKNVVKSGKPIFAEKNTINCQCGMMLTKQDVTKLVRDIKLKDVYQCPRCGAETIAPRIKIEAKYN